MSKLMTEIERQSIEQRIAKIENDTSGEIVIAIKERAARYHVWAIAAAAIGAAIAMVVTNSAVSQGGTVVVELRVLGYAALIGAVIVGGAFFIGPIQALILPRSVFEQAVRAAAARHFAAHGVGRTKDQSGVLLYMAVFERQAVVLADEGLTRLVSEGFWESQAVVLRSGLVRRQLPVAIHKVLGAMGEVLHAKLPAGRHNSNELPNRLDLP